MVSILALKRYCCKVEMSTVVSGLCTIDEAQPAALDIRQRVVLEFALEGGNRE